MEAPEILARIAAWQPGEAAVQLRRAAELLGLCPHTLRRAIAAGELKAPPAHPPLPQLIKREDLVRFVAGRAAEDAAAA